MISTELIEDDAVDPPFFASLAVQATTIYFFITPNSHARTSNTTDRLKHNRQTHTTKPIPQQVRTTNTTEGSQSNRCTVAPWLPDCWSTKLKQKPPPPPPPPPPPHHHHTTTTTTPPPWGFAFPTQTKIYVPMGYDAVIPSVPAKI